MNKYKIVSVLLLIFLVLSGCKNQNEGETKTEIAPIDEEMLIDDDYISISKQQFESEKMSLATAEEKIFPTTIKTTGTIDVPPSNKAIISAFAGGYIKNTPLLVGDVVKKGQSLLTIENIEFVDLQQAFIETAQKQEFLRSEYTRQKELFEENISSKKKYQKAKNDLELNSVMYKGLYKKLQMLHINPEKVKNGNISSVTSIYSPIKGSITRIEVSTGTFVSPEDEIMEIINTEHIHLELKVFEKDILKIKEGQKVRFKIPEFSDEYFEGDIHLIGKSIDENRMVQVHAHIDESTKHTFIVGMFVDAEVIISSEKSLSLVEGALIESEDNYYILVLNSQNEEGYIFVKKLVEIGSAKNEFTQILNPEVIKPDDKILVGGFNLIGNE